MNTTTTDLMYAAYLIVLGSTIDRIESTGRYNKIHLHVPERALEVLSNKTARLDRLSSRSEGINEIDLVFNMSILKDISDQYFILKKKLARLK